MTDQVPPQQGDPLLNKLHQGSPPSGKDATKDSLHARGQWASKAEFLLAVAGQIIGLGNVWRFPYLCYKNGGGVFFVPYLLFLVLCGIPLFLLETSLGQYTSLGGVGAWRSICPLFGGTSIQSIPVSTSIQNPYKQCVRNQKIWHSVLAACVCASY